MRTFENELLEALFRYSQDILLVLNNEGKVAAANERAVSLFGCSPVGKGLADLFEGAEIAPESISSSPIIHTLHLRRRLGQKREYPVSVTFVPVVCESQKGEVLLVGKDLFESISYRDELERMQGRINALEKKVSEGEEYASEAIGTGDSMKNLTEKLKAANQRLEEINAELIREMELAALVQKSMVPAAVSDHPYLRFSFHYEPMGHVGGDYYDIIDLRDGRKGVFVADVSGHGVYAAFIAAMLKMSFFSTAPLYDSPSELLERLNMEYCRVITTGDYVTAFYAIFEPRARRVIFSGAGHPSPVLCKRNGRFQSISSEGFFLGMFEGAEYESRVLEIGPGDRLIMYTDGIIEAYAEDRAEQFGIDRLNESVKKYASEPLDEMVKGIIRDVKDFMQKSSFYDDLAVIAVEQKRREDGAGQDKKDFKQGKRASHAAGYRAEG